MILKKEDAQYMASRGYDLDNLKKDKPFSIKEGWHTFGTLKFISPVDSIGLKVKSAGGSSYGLHLFSRLERSYRTLYDKEITWYPALYGSNEDYRIFYQTGKVIIVEGIFDRIPFKICKPEYACFAKLNKSVSLKLINFLHMYSTEVHAAYDMDEAGESAFEKIYKKSQGKFNVTRLKLPYKDPNEAFVKLSVSGFSRHISDHFRFRIDSLRN